MTVVSAASFHSLLVHVSNCRVKILQIVERELALLQSALESMIRNHFWERHL